MARYIDADAVIEFIENRYDITWKDDYEGGIKDACVDILEKIKNIPTADVVEVVRCRDCRYKQLKNLTWFCPFGLPSGPDGYCNYGERKEDGRLH